VRVYHREHAGRPLRVVWTLEELGVPYELTVMSREEAGGEEHLARHPLGRVPVVEYDGARVFESAAICLQLADMYPEAELAPPAATPERAMLYQWVIFAPAELEPPLLEAAFRARKDPERAAAALSRFKDAADAVAAALASSEYLVADRFTVADVLVGTTLSWTLRAGYEDSLPPSLRDYIARLTERPALQRALARTGG